MSYNSGRENKGNKKPKDEPKKRASALKMSAQRGAKCCQKKVSSSFSEADKGKYKTDWVKALLNSDAEESVKKVWLNLGVSKEDFDPETGKGINQLGKSFWARAHYILLDEKPKQVMAICSMDAIRLTLVDAIIESYISEGLKKQKVSAPVAGDVDESIPAPE